MQKFLVIQTAFIGDAILTLPMIQKLKENNPGSTIDVISIPGTAEIFQCSPSVNEVLIFDKRGKHKSFFSIISFSKKIRDKKYTAIYSAHRSFRTSILVLLSGIKETYGFSNSSLKQVYKHIVKYENKIHEVARNLKLIGFDTSYDNWEILPEINVPDVSWEKVNLFLKNISDGKNYVAVAPGSVWNTKKYPLEYYEEIIKWFTEQNYTVLLMGGESDKGLCFEISSKFHESVINTAGKFSLIESVELLKNTKLLVCNDSAPTHLGMCADIPVLTIYCSTVAEFGFYPYNRRSNYLSYDDLNCKPCGIHGYDKCPVKTFECGYELKPEMVISKAKQMLND